MSSAVQQVAKKPLTQVQSVKELLFNDQAKGQLAAVAAKHMNPERMMRVVANAIRTTPKLQQCEPMSFLGALMQTAALGLEPNTILGQAYMIPFENKRKGITEVQVVVGYKGLIDLARRSGHITSLSANIHYSDDELWIYEEGTEAQLRHRPGPMRGEKLHAYAIAKFKDGGHAYVVLPWAKVLEIRDGSQGYQTAKRYGKLADAPWVKHEDEMAKKTAVRALAKYLPLSVEFMDAMQIDESKMDYRGFAFDPEHGVSPEEGDFIEGAAEEQAEDPRQIEPQKEAAPAARRQTRAKADPAPAQREPEAEHQHTHEAEAEPAAESGDMFADRPSRREEQADAAAAEEVKRRLSRAFSMITGDMMDGSPASRIFDAYRLDLAEMRKVDPEMFKRLMEEADSFEAGASKTLSA